MVSTAPSWNLAEVNFARHLLQRIAFLSRGLCFVSWFQTFQPIIEGRAQGGSDARKTETRKGKEKQEQGVREGREEDGIVKRRVRRSGEREERGEGGIVKGRGRKEREGHEKGEGRGGGGRERECT